MDDKFQEIDPEKMDECIIKLVDTALGLLNPENKTSPYSEHFQHTVPSAVQVTELVGHAMISSFVTAYKQCRNLGEDAFAEEIANGTIPKSFASTLKEMVGREIEKVNKTPSREDIDAVARRLETMKAAAAECEQFDRAELDAQLETGDLTPSDYLDKIKPVGTA